MNKASEKPACSSSQAAGSASILKLEAKFFSATSADLQRTTQRYILEDRILHNHCCENVKFLSKKLGGIIFMNSSLRCDVTDDNSA
jgi:putative lipase involved disintegration of autophagic bodies